MADIVKVPSLNELLLDEKEAYKNDAFNLLLSQPPPEKWIKEHPFIKQKGPNGTSIAYKYLPIDKVEHLLRKIFKRFKIEITGQGTAFNGVWVTVRIHFMNPVTGEWDYHDGIGASQLQTKKDTSPADLANINNGAITMAFPMAKTLAVKDACDHFGSIFGANLNRRDTVEFDEGWSSQSVVLPLSDEVKVKIHECVTVDDLTNVYKSYKVLHSNPEFMNLLTQKKNQIANANQDK